MNNPWSPDTCTSPGSGTSGQMIVCSNPTWALTKPCGSIEVVSAWFLMEIHVGEALLSIPTALPFPAPCCGASLGLDFGAAGAGTSSGAAGAAGGVAAVLRLWRVDGHAPGSAALAGHRLRELLDSEPHGVRGDVRRRVFRCFLFPISDESIYIYHIYHLSCSSSTCRLLFSIKIQGFPFLRHQHHAQSSIFGGRIFCHVWLGMGGTQMGARPSPSSSGGASLLRCAPFGAEQRLDDRSHWALGRLGLGADADTAGCAAAVCPRQGGQKRGGTFWHRVVFLPFFFFLSLVFCFVWCLRENLGMFRRILAL